ncbi:MAG: TIGR00153 family protein [Pseudomonadota bacterium]
MSNVFASIFGTSPVGSMEKHIAVAHKCANQLVGFFKAAIAGDWEEAQRIREKIEDLENQADDLKKEIRLNLPKSLFMPVPREDLLKLLLVQDMIANRAKDVSGIVMGRQLQVPGPIAEDFLVFVERCTDATRQARQSVRELDELFTTGFRGAEAKLVEEMIEVLDTIETETDGLEADLRRKFFAIERDYEPVNVMFLYQVISLIGEIADMAERVGRRLELLLSH